MRSFADLTAICAMARCAYQVTALQATTEIKQEVPDASFICFVGKPSCQAAMFRWRGMIVLAFRGTQFKQNTNLHEIWDDLEGDPEEVPYVGSWHPGAADGLDLVLAGIRSFVGSDELLLTGHSLGAARSCLFPALLPRFVAVEVIAFEPFRCMDEQFRNTIYPYANQRPLVVVNDDSFVPDYPLLHPSYRLPNDEFLWLNGKSADIASSRAAIGTSIVDHDVDIIYNKFKALRAAEQVVSPHAAL